MRTLRRTNEARRRTWLPSKSSSFVFIARRAQQQRWRWQSHAAPPLVCRGGVPRAIKIMSRVTQFSAKRYHTIHYGRKLGLLFNIPFRATVIEILRFFQRLKCDPYVLAYHKSISRSKCVVRRIWRWRIYYKTLVWSRIRDIFLSYWMLSRINTTTSPSSRPP